MRAEEGHDQNADACDLGQQLQAAAEEGLEGVAAPAGGAEAESVAAAEAQAAVEAATAIVAQAAVEAAAAIVAQAAVEAAAATVAQAAAEVAAAQEDVQTAAQEVGEKWEEDVRLDSFGIRWDLRYYGPARLTRLVEGQAGASNLRKMCTERRITIAEQAQRKTYVLTSYSKWKKSQPMG